MIRSAETGDGDVILLCRGLTKGNLNWMKGMDICKRLKDQNAESLRIIIHHYFTQMALNTKGENRAGPILAVMEAFSTPYPTQAGIGYLVTDLGRLLLASD